MNREISGGGETDRYPRSVLVFPSDKQRSCLHSTQKPLALEEYLIRTYTNEGDLILDNCMGSGTTIVACINTKRKYIGIEKLKRQFNVAKNRIKELEQINKIVNKNLKLFKQLLNNKP